MSCTSKFRYVVYAMHIHKNLKSILYTYLLLCKVSLSETLCLINNYLPTLERLSLVWIVVNAVVSHC